MGSQNGIVSAQGKPLLSFGVISDVQYADIPDGRSFIGVPRYYRHSILVLQSAVQNWNNHQKLKFVVNFGDIVDGFCPKDQSLNVVKKVLNEFDKFNGPVYHMIGNHCLYNLPRHKLIPLLKIPTLDRHAYYDFSPIPGYRFVVLDGYDISAIGWPQDHPNTGRALNFLKEKNPNSEKNSPEGLVGLERRFLKFNGAVGKEQLGWLDCVLQDATKLSQKVVVCCHLPLDPGSSSQEALLWNYDEVMDMIHRYNCVKVCLGGHDHIFCAIWVLTAMIGAATLIWKYEGFNKVKTRRRGDQRDSVGFLYKDEAWRTYSKAIHPAWLLAYRIIAFIVLLGLLVVNVVIDGGAIFYFYTQWTFTLVTLYFGLGSLFSIYGCFYCCNEVDGDRLDCVGLDTERGTYVAPTLGGNANLSSIPINLISQEEPLVRKTAGIWGYFFQIIFQMCAGAVLLTDSVFWFVIYPFLTGKDYRLNFLIVSLHSLNAVFLFGDMILNYLRFPFFRIAYFVQWTCIFVLFQWIIHACVSMWWPYSFLDLSSSYAPIWYLAVGLLHLPCYGILVLIVRTKQVCLSSVLLKAQHRLHLEHY